MMNNVRGEETEEDRSGFICIEDFANNSHFMLEASQDGIFTKDAQVLFDDIAKRNKEYMRKRELE